VSINKLIVLLQKLKISCLKQVSINSNPIILHSFVLYVNVDVKIYCCNVIIYEWITFHTFAVLMSRGCVFVCKLLGCLGMSY